MNCYDCATRGQSEPAVGNCVSCSAGICADCVRTKQQRVDQHSTLGNPLLDTTRKLLCTSCAEVLAGRTLDAVG
jgi:hypothetical protein